MKKAFFLLFLCVGLAISVFGLRGCYYGRASMHWPIAEGKIIESKIGISRGGNRTTYYPQVRYRYDIGSRRYASDRIYFSGIDLAGDHDYASSLKDRYPEGHTVAVYYNPEDAGVSVLLPGIRRETWLALAFGGVFGAFGLLGLYLDRRRGRKMEAEKR